MSKERGKKIQIDCKAITTFLCNQESFGVDFSLTMILANKRRVYLMVLFSQIQFSEKN